MLKMTSLPKVKIPAPMTGVENLQSSHFTLAQEESWTPWTQLSVFKKDYIPYKLPNKQDSAKLNPPVEIFNKDERFFNNHHSSSETVAEYQPKPLSGKATYDTYKLRKTNFKMDSDERHPSSYESIHKTSYLPKDGEYKKMEPAMDSSKSHIPQGDKEKAPLPVSDYRERFRGVQAEREPFHKATAGPSTVRGDNRQHNYQTTHNEMFKGSWQDPIKPLEPHRTSAIPQGDPSKEWGHHTEFREAYKGHTGHRGYDRNSLGNMQKTQFRLDDGHDTYNDYSTTMTASYVPKQSSAQRTDMSAKRNHSDIPDGDTDFWRQVERGTTTTYNHDMRPAPNSYQRNPIVDGASIRTKSQVPFGDPAQFNNFYTTTNQETYVPQNGIAVKADPSSQGRSHIPLDYYSGELPGTTTHQSSYLDPKQEKMALNEQALLRLKMTNIPAPLGAARYFSTTHRDHYIPLDLEEATKIDASRFQKSSVPLGTLY